MVADRIPNPCHEGSTPSTDAFSGIHGYRYEQLTTGHSSHFLPGRRRSGGLPCGAARAPGKTPGHARAAVPGPRSRPGDVDQLWASGKATSFGMRTTGVRVPPAGPGARRMLCYRPSGRHERALRRKSAPHPARGAQRPWLNWREHLSTKQERAGSSPAGRAVSEAEAGDAPGCGPGGSGFEPRRTPDVRRAAASYTIQRSTPRPGPIWQRRLAQDQEVQGSSPWGRTTRPTPRSPT